MMKTSANDTYLDLIFRNKNRTYGAYELRKNDNRRMMRAGIIVMSIFGLLVGLQRVTEHTGMDHPDKVLSAPPVIIHNIELPREKEQIRYLKTKGDPRPLQATTARKIQTDHFTDPVIVNNDQVKPEEKIGNPSRMTRVGPERKDGVVSEPNTAYRKEGIRESEGSFNEADTVASGAGSDLPIRNGVDQKAEYLGDMNHFLSTHLHYPQIAMAQNIEGEVVLEFIVDRHGQVSSIQVLKGIGGGCDEEAIRVVKKMKHWKPARKNGVEVAAYFLLPIRFQLN